MKDENKSQLTRLCGDIDRIELFIDRRNLRVYAECAGGLFEVGMDKKWISVMTGVDVAEQIRRDPRGEDMVE